MAMEANRDNEALEVCERLYRSGEKLTVRRLREECGIRTERAAEILRQFWSGKENNGPALNDLELDIHLEQEFDRIRALARGHGDARAQAVERAYSVLAETAARETATLRKELDAALEAGRAKDGRIAEFEAAEVQKSRLLAELETRAAALATEKAELLQQVAQLHARVSARTATVNEDLVRRLRELLQKPRGGKRAQP